MRGASTSAALTPQGPAELERRGVHAPPHLIAPMEDHDLSMAFSEDPDGHTLAVMQEAPKSYVPGT
jgi:hypothetical protein